MPEEDPYLYTTVTIVPEKKKKHEKDFLFCIVFIGCMFAVMACQLSCYTFRLSGLSFVKEVQIKKMQEIAKDMQLKYDKGSKVLQRQINHVLPKLRNIKYSSVCKHYVGDINAVNLSFRIDNLPEFLVFKGTTRETFMSFQDVKWHFTSNILWVNGFNFMAKLTSKIGQQDVEFVNSIHKQNDIKVFSLKVCFVKRGVLNYDNPTPAPTRRLKELGETKKSLKTSNFKNSRR